MNLEFLIAAFAAAGLGLGAYAVFLRRQRADVTVTLGAQRDGRTGDA